jgi:hypothetical protein
MKKLAFLFVFSVLVGSAAAQNNPIGTYEQTSFTAPDNIKHSENDLVITQDPQAAKKIWITNLIDNSKIYAVVSTKGEDKIVYKVPPQTVGNLIITVGCVVYDKEDKTVVVSLNNKDNCLGINQSDYGKVSMGKEGISAGGVSVSKDGINAGNTRMSNGTMSGGGVDMANGEAKVDAKKVMAGVQFVGHKKGD